VYRFMHPSNRRRYGVGFKHLLLSFGLMLVVVAGQFFTPRADAAAGSSLRVVAPRRVDVGQPITLTLQIRDAVDIAGYETNLLYDTTAAEFSGLGQRENDLRKWGRDVSPLGPVEFKSGVAFGLSSCPVANCVRRDGRRQNRGGRGHFQLATVSVLPTRAGLLQLTLAGTKFVDAVGRPVAVAGAEQTFVVQVGANRARIAAPAMSWKLKLAQPAASAPDLSGDGLITNADAMEVALAWTTLRERGVACGHAERTRDTNNDGCVDVSDFQHIVSAYSAAGAQPRRPAARSGSSGTVTTMAQTPMTFVVNSTGDAPDADLTNTICATANGECTLRAAMASASRHPGADTITFAIPGDGVQTITIGSTLPTINDASGPTIIDGYTQPGASPNTDPVASNAVIRIEIAGPKYNSFDGIMITSARNIVRGLAIYRLKNVIRIFGAGATDNVVAGNIIGTNAAATEVAPGRIDGNGVQLHQGANRNYVGTTNIADRNVISGNGLHGIMTSNEYTNYNYVYNNIVGLDPTGTRRVLNWRNGIDINSRSSNNFIGGSGPNEHNVISGNGYEGIELSHDTLTVGNRVVGNYVGTNLAGTRSFPYTINEQHGIHIEDGVQNNIVAENVVGNSGQGGIYFKGYYTYDNQAYNNLVGVSLDGTAIPNNNFGVQVGYHAARAKIGPGNVIANNPIGVIVANDDNLYNTITRNMIYGNAGLGIDLGPLGRTNPNDVGDADSGPNSSLNFPVLSNALPTEARGTACANCVVEVFVSDGGANAYGEGSMFAGAVTAEANGTFTVALSGVDVGDYVTATATDVSGNTSEFALNMLVTATRAPLVADTFSRNVTNGWGTAETGGAYTTSGTAADLSVNGSAGVFTIARGQSRGALAQSASALDSDHVFSVQTDRVATGSSLYIYSIARRVSSTSEYQGRMRLDPSGRVYLSAATVINGAVTELSTPVLVSGLTHRAGAKINLRMQVTGTNPTKIALRAWADGQAEPTTWQYSVTNGHTTLQKAGSVGIRSYASSGLTNGPVSLVFDDFVVTNIQP
jgi:CSLREA domain-containing protein